MADLKAIIRQGEGISVEFKECSRTLSRDVYETVCAFLNRHGGNLLLGVNDDGAIVGVEETAVETMVKNLVNLSNNPQKLDPPFILFPQTHHIHAMAIIHIQVPASSQVHKTAQTIFDRSNDGDFRIAQPQQIADMYNRKRTHYTENLVYQALRFADFKVELFSKARNLIKSNNANHPWLGLNDQQLLERAGLWKRDFQTGQEGYTLAAALLFGKDETIQQILPHYKIDALVRVSDTSRYDDRLYIQTNLIEAYEQLMDFVAKHLPDRFYLQADQRVSLRTLIFREVAANLIVHREYTNAYPCTFVIRQGGVETENANNPHGEGAIDPANFTSFPKNPVLSKFFTQIGRVEELGSGVVNVYRFMKEYSGNKAPEFIEGPVFKMHIPIPESKRDDESVRSGEGLSEGLSEGLKTVLKAIEEIPGIKAKDISQKLNERPIKTIERQINQLKKLGFIERKGSRKTGGYYLTGKKKGQI